MIIEIVLPIPVKSKFIYICSIADNPVVGSRVVVPFRNRKVVGIIVSTYRKNFSTVKAKKIIRIIDKESIFIPSVWNLILWSVNYYKCFIGTIIFSFLPYLLKKGNILKKKYITNGKLLKKEFKLIYDC